MYDRVLKLLRAYISCVSDFKLLPKIKHFSIYIFVTFFLVCFYAISAQHPQDRAIRILSIIDPMKQLQSPTSCDMFASSAWFISEFSMMLPRIYVKAEIRINFSLRLNFRFSIKKFWHPCLIYLFLVNSKFIETPPVDGYWYIFFDSWFEVCVDHRLLSLLRPIEYFLFCKFLHLRSSLITKIYWV